MPKEISHYYGAVPQAWEKFFAPLAPDLRQFASQYNLLLELYYHEAPSWRFNFRHPKGGIGSVDVVCQSDRFLKIGLYWWIDDYDTFARRSRFDETPSYEIAEIDLPEILENRLREILSWETHCDGHRNRV